MALLDTFKHLRLRRQGLAGNRRRLAERRHAIWGQASESGWLRFALMAVFALVATAMVLWPEALWNWDALGDSAVRLSLALVAISLLFALLLLPEAVERNERFSLIFGVLLLQLFVGEMIGGAIQSENEAVRGFLPFVLPHAFAPLLLTLLASERVGAVTAVISALWQTLMLDLDDKWTVFASACLVGVGAVLMAGELRNRRQLLRTGILIGCIHLISALIFGKLAFPSLRDSGDFLWLWDWLLTQIALALASGIGTTIVVVSLLPLFESLFRLTSPPTWIELTDLNHPLLRRLSIEAPGTYHHSLQVATLAEAAAEAIGADATRCRVCAYFHDIGKLEKPNYFIENQGEENPHDNLTPTMSALVILAHVKDGVSLALKHRLNRDILDTIKEHHGTSLVGYFYHKALKLREEALAEVEEGKRNEEDVPRVAPDSFRYPGPRPRSPESAIISLADSIESASRSLDKVTPTKLEQLVRDIFLSRLEDDQLDECGLTMRELKVVRESFCKRLRTMNHHRVSYPAVSTETENSELDQPTVPAGPTTRGGRSDPPTEKPARAASRALSKAEEAASRRG